MEFLKAKNVHFIGLGGIGVSAIARYFASQGAKVSGSDRADFDQAQELRKHGIKVFTSHDAKNLSPKTEAVVYSSAVPADNPEIALAREKGIPMFEYVEALGEIMKGKYGIGVSGTNGKTSTTAMLGKILEADKMDPMVIVGGKVPGWDANLRLPVSPRTALGKKPRAVLGEEIFVAEACEYRRHFLKLAPRMIILTNIEAEHLDYFKDIADIKNAFSEYVGKLPKDGFLVYNDDDKNVVEVCKNIKAHKISCSLRKRTADIFASNIRYEKGRQVFRVFWKKEDLGDFKIGVPGIFNVMNALEALGSALALGAKTESSRKALAKFHGTWRRFERVGKVGKTVIISDYAHHPAGVGATIQAAKELYPDQKILFIFQPHQKDRTLKLMHEFADVLKNADDLILSEIYEVAGRNESEKEVSSQDLVREVLKLRKSNIEYGSSLKETEQIVRKMLPYYHAVVIMGAGDVYKIAESLS
ncbi:MAG: UDP-N-acetylmuramate--L-alanine ligase [Candidatus Paceibacterota bacterium]|jgi:UDP-N-acetylmuramate--alanine ligase|nr:UDP-N-acetylmuramate--L-alanine ligase [Candidatus Paceibacterota bacterium]